jgi:cation transporter-like permease
MWQVKVAYKSSFVRLISVVDWLYFILTHVTSAFSLSLVHYGFSSRLQHLGYSPSASVFSLPVNTTISDLIILEFIFWTTKLRKQLYKNVKYDI